MASETSWPGIVRDAPAAFRAAFGEMVDEWHAVRQKVLDLEEHTASLRAQLAGAEAAWKAMPDWRRKLWTVETCVLLGAVGVAFELWPSHYAAMILPVTSAASIWSFALVITAVGVGGAEVLGHLLAERRDHPLSRVEEVLLGLLPYGLAAYALLTFLMRLAFAELSAQKAAASGGGGYVASPWLLALALTLPALLGLLLGLASYRREARDVRAKRLRIAGLRREIVRAEPRLREAVKERDVCRQHCAKVAAPHVHEAFSRAEPAGIDPPDEESVTAYLLGDGPRPAGAGEAPAPQRAPAPSSNGVPVRGPELRAEDAVRTQGGAAHGPD